MKGPSSHLAALVTLDQDTYPEGILSLPRGITRDPVNQSDIVLLCKWTDLHTTEALLLAGKEARLTNSGVAHNRAQISESKVPTIISAQANINTHSPDSKLRH